MQFKSMFLLLLALVIARFSFGQNYILEGTGGVTGPTGPTGTSVSPIFDDGSGNVAIGNTGPAARLDVTGDIAGTTVIQAGYGIGSYTPGPGTPNYFIGSRTPTYENFPPGTGVTVGPPIIDFSVNNIGQVTIGSAPVPDFNVDLFIKNHGYACGTDLPGQPFFAVQDDASNLLMVGTNVGDYSFSSAFLGIMSSASNTLSCRSYNPALMVFDQSSTLSNPAPIFGVIGSGLVTIGAGGGSTDAIAKLDVVQNTTELPLDYVFHVGTYNNSDEDYVNSWFSVNSNGYIGIGQLNSGSSMVEISDVTGLGTTMPLFQVDNGTPSTSVPYFKLYGSSSGVNAGIGIDPLSMGSTLALKGLGSTALDIYNGTSSSGINGEIRFVSGSDTRHIIGDDVTGNNLVIQPGVGGGANGVVEVDGNEKVTGTVVIGNVTAPCTTGSCYNLYVQNGILAERFKCAASTDGTNWSDYVFDKKYKLMSIEDLEKFVKLHKHLPGIPTANDVNADGIDLGDMDAKLLAKIEELSLYVMEQQKQINDLKKRVK